MTDAEEAAMALGGAALGGGAVLGYDLWLDRGLDGVDITSSVTDSGLFLEAKAPGHEGAVSGVSWQVTHPDGSQVSVSGETATAELDVVGGEYIINAALSLDTGESVDVTRRLTVPDNIVDQAGLF